MKTCIEESVFMPMPLPPDRVPHEMVHDAVMPMPMPCRM